MVFARHSTWTHALQVFAVLQGWGSIWWFISFIDNRSPHILPCVLFCIIPDASCPPNSVSLRSAPLACPERLSASRNVVEQHGKTVLRVPNSSLPCPDLVHYFCQHHLVICVRCEVICNRRSKMSLPSTTLQTVDVFFLVPAKAQRVFLFFWSTEYSSLPSYRRNN